MSRPNLLCGNLVQKNREASKTGDPPYHAQDRLRDVVIKDDDIPLANASESLYIGPYLYPFRSYPEGREHLSLNPELVGLTHFMLPHHVERGCTLHYVLQKVKFAENVKVL